MAYKCVECGHIFEYGEESVWVEPDGEPGNGCPICMSAFEVTQRCFCCGSEQFEEDLFAGGICRDCLKSRITPEVTARYVSEKDLERHFYVGFYYNSAFDDISDELLQLAKSSFISMAGFESIGAKNGCTEKCVDFICGDGNADLDDFARWLSDHSCAAQQGVKRK